MLSKLKYQQLKGIAKLCPLTPLLNIQRLPTNAKTLILPDLTSGRKTIKPGSV